MIEMMIMMVEVIMIMCVVVTIETAVSISREKRRGSRLGSASERDVRLRQERKIIFFRNNLHIQSFKEVKLFIYVFRTGVDIV